MEQGTFDLTQPNVSQPARNLPKVPQEVKTFTVSMGPKKEPPKVVATAQKLPNLTVSVNPNAQVTTQSKTQNMQSSKSVPKPTKIDMFRTVIEQVQTQQQQQLGNKKDKKPVQVGAQSTKALKEVYSKQVIENINRLYEHHSDNQVHIAYELKQMEKKRNIQQELERKEQKMNREKQEHDEMLYDIKQKQKKIKQLDAIINELGNTFAKEEDYSVREEKKQQVENLEEVIAQAQHETSILTNMFNSRRKLLLFIQKQCTETFDELALQQQRLSITVNSQAYRENNIHTLSKMISKYRMMNTEGGSIWGSLWKSNFDPGLQNMLEDELSLFEDKKMFKEVIDHEKKIEEEKEKAVEEQQRLDSLKAKQDRDKANEKIRQDKKKIENQLNEKRKMFEKLRKVTRVSDLEQIIPHKNELEAGKQELTLIEKLLEKDLESHQEQIEDLTERIKVLQFQTGAEDEENQVKIDDLERDLIKEYDVLQDKEKQVKRVEKSIDEVTVAMSRIMYQLQGKGTKTANIEIKREKLVSTASVVSLRLERMLTVLSKKKEFLNEESVNTNPRYFKVPEFIGLNQKTYAEMEGKDFIENDVFVYREDDSFDEDLQNIDRNRQLVKTFKDKEEEERERLKEQEKIALIQKEKEKEKLSKKDGKAKKVPAQ